MESIHHAPAEDSRPDIRELFQVFSGPVDVRSLTLTGIFLLSTLYTVYFTREVLLPVVLAFVLSFLLAPVVRSMSRLRIPGAIGAGIIILGLIGAGAYGTYLLSDPARQWLEKAPTSFNIIRKKLRDFIEPMEKARETTKQIENITVLGKKEPNIATVEIKKPGLGEFVFASTQNFLLGCGMTLVLLYFLLAAEDLFLLKLVKVLPSLDDKKRAVEICRQIEQDVSTYLWTITLVNVGLGLVVGLSMYFLGMPNPALWGVLAAFLTYIPYLGALTGIISIGLAAALTFTDPIKIILAPSIYFLAAIIEGNFITPIALGRSLALNPVVIFIWLLFWGWAWGILGVVLAVPLLAIVRIICRHFKSLAALGEFLGNEPTAANS